MTQLSPSAQAIWEAFNREEAGILVDYGDKLAAALRAVVDQKSEFVCCTEKHGNISVIFSDDIFALAAELEGRANGG
jgi:hypothetical protein